ncbi:DsbA family protein [Salibaculum griseiflavum]|jgi:protein-disulfide isomerase|uniref:Thiol-disulfide oxidoreductase n=1 Tax=Salibaculum griseiflavum TaxID=1914409 RepID=A0A2V1P1K4_9RHOB|nr:DsbA family protein [Salibaculum griseiflavum]PWG16421.1 thiol-disulfide oxidoreductase [Salibaculum griseiflavum]
MKNALLATVAVAAVAGGAWFLSRPAVPADPVLGAALAQDAEYDASQIIEMVKGAEDAPVEVIEYASFTCPHCANFHDNQYPQIEENYIDTGKVRFVYREVYFDRPGLWASMVARCGGEERFFGITDLIYERQDEWARRESGEEIISDLRRIGKVAGLTDEDLDACLTDGETAQNLYGWYLANAEADDVQGTPSFVINGEKYSNMSYDDFAAILDEKLAEADAAE